MSVATQEQPQRQETVESLDNVRKPVQSVQSAPPEAQSASVKHLRELRAIKDGDSKIGFYDDIEVFQKYAQELNDQGYNIYSPINPILPGTAEQLGYTINAAPRTGKSTGNPHILRRTVLPFDLDCVRSGKTAATEAMRHKAMEQAAQLEAWWLDKHGVQAEMVDSGNGFHVRIPINLPNDEESSELIKAVIEVLARQFSTPEVKIDNLYDAARILRVPGYKNKKDSEQRKCERFRTAAGMVPQAVLEEIAESQPGFSEVRRSLGVQMPEDWNPDVELRKAGLAFKTRVEGNRISFDYYSEMGKCFLKNAPHSSNNNARKSRFLWNPETRVISHQCFAASCQERTDKTPTVLRNLGIRVDTLTLAEKLKGMNEKYCYVDDGDAVVRIAGMRMYKYHQFVNGGHLANQFHLMTEQENKGKAGRPKTKPEKLARLWGEWAERKHVDRICYEPGQPRFTQGCINRWQGMGVEPVKGDVTPWLMLLERLIPNPSDRKWFEQWCAYPLQYLGTKLKSCAVIWSTRQGTGKTTLAHTLGLIYGSNFAAINENHLHAPFNSWALDKQFVYADEISGGDKRAFADHMKEIIAGSKDISVNQKFLPEITIRNCINFLFTSNHPDSFYLEATDRRYFVVEAPSVEEDTKFFERYYAWLESGGAAHVYHHLLNLSLENFHPHANPPMTEAKEDLIEIGKSELERWMDEVKYSHPNLVIKAEQLLTEFRNTKGESPVKTKGITAALKRVGAVSTRLKVNNKVERLWAMNPAFKDASPDVWKEHWHKSKAEKFDRV